MTGHRKDQARAVAVLVSGGIESAALLAEALRRYERVYPIYVRKGFVWETVELAHLKRLLPHFRADGLAQLAVLELPQVPLEPVAFRLVEAVAESAAQHVLARFPVKRVRIRARKFSVPGSESVGVEIVRPSARSGRTG